MDDSPRGDTGSPGTPAEAVEDVLLDLFRSGRGNAVLSWAMVGVLGLVFVESALDLDVQWTVFVGTAALLVVLPPAAHRDWKVMLPWELLVLALMPILVRGLSGGELGLFAMYLSVAALALITVVELHSFTGLTVTHWFAIALVVLATMAGAGAWAVVRWHLDLYVGTAFLSTNDALMREFLWVTLAGFAAGILFDAYFRRRTSLLRRVLAWVVRR